MVHEIPTLPVVMLGQILYDKTIDVGKECKYKDDLHLGPLKDFREVSHLAGTN
jgi:hypothetical protein